MSRIDKARWIFVILAIAYFVAHIIVAKATGRI